MNKKHNIYINGLTVGTSKTALWLVEFTDFQLITHFCTGYSAEVNKYKIRKNTDNADGILAPVSVSSEVEPQLENVILELTFESVFVRVLPFSVYYLKSNVL